MTFAEGFLRLVRAGGLLDPAAGNYAAPEGDLDVDGARHEAWLPAQAFEPAAAEPEAIDPRALAEAMAQTDPDAVVAQAMRPGLSDIEAAVALVTTGLANRVVLTGFQSWPGLLWEAYKLADASGVVILPSVVRPGGRVDIVIERDATVESDASPDV